MMNAGNKKLRLVLLALALFACSVMALGGTFASQVDMTDEANKTYDENEVLDYNVSVMCHDGKNYSKSLLTPDSAIFTEDVLWCPGYTKIVYLKVTNNEAFPVNCGLNLTFTDSGFDNKMSYAVIYGLQPNAEEHPSNWQTFYDKANVKGTLLKNSENKPYTVFAPVDFNSGDEASRYFALAIHMDETADNNYQKAKMELSFNFRVNAEYTPAPKTNP